MEATFQCPILFDTVPYSQGGRVNCGSFEKSGVVHWFNYNSIVQAADEKNECPVCRGRYTKITRENGEVTWVEDRVAGVEDNIGLGDFFGFMGDDEALIGRVNQLEEGKLSPIDFSDTTQSDQWGYEIKFIMYQKAQKIVSIPVVGNLMGIPLAVADIVISIAFHVVAQAVEPIFKGLVNICLAPFYDEFSFSAGLGMLYWDFPKELFESVIYAVVFVFVVPIKLSTQTVEYLISPEDSNRFYIEKNIT